MLIPYNNISLCLSQSMIDFRFYLLAISLNSSLLMAIESCGNISVVYSRNNFSLPKISFVSCWSLRKASAYGPQARITVLKCDQNDFVPFIRSKR